MGLSTNWISRMIMQQISFILTLGIAIYFIRKRILRIKNNVLLGRKKEIKDKPSERLSNMLFVAFGQKKMFRNPLVALLHFFIYAGFIIINLEVLEIFLWKCFS